MTDRVLTVLTDEAIKHLLKAFKNRDICSADTLREVIASHRLQAARIEKLEGLLEQMRGLDD